MKTTVDLSDLNKHFISFWQRHCKLEQGDCERINLSLQSGCMFGFFPFYHMAALMQKHTLV